MIDPLVKLQNDSISAAQSFMGLANETPNPKEAADWSLAAKNAASVALIVEQIQKTGQR